MRLLKHLAKLRLLKRLAKLDSISEVTIICEGGCGGLFWAPSGTLHTVKVYGRDDSMYFCTRCFNAAKNTGRVKSSHQTHKRGKGKKGKLLRPVP